MSGIFALILAVLVPSPVDDPSPCGAEAAVLASLPHPAPLPDELLDDLGRREVRCERGEDDEFGRQIAGWPLASYGWAPELLLARSATPARYAHLRHIPSTTRLRC
ncbi:MAG: hypothetical protein U0800_20795 [Isosphaeraceae bacterium]